MSLSVFDAIMKLPGEFSPDTREREGPLLVAPSLRLRDSLGGFLTELRWNRDYHLKSQALDLDDVELRRRMLECHHYMDNVCVLLWFFHDYLERCRQARARSTRLSYRLAPFLAQPRLARVLARFAARSRYVIAPLRGFAKTNSDEHLLDVQSYLLPIQADKLLGDVRSFLDSVYALMLVFTPPEVKLPLKVRESFGKFADRHDDNKLPALALPLTLLEELVPWGQTVRKMRDDYVHRGKGSIAMPRFGPQNGAAQVYFDLHGFSKRPGKRDLPGALYATDNPNDLLDLELLVLYIVVPVFALRHALGEALHEHYSQSLSEWKPMGDNSSVGGGGISALGVMLQRRPEVVDTGLYRFRRPKPTPKVK